MVKNIVDILCEVKNEPELISTITKESDIINDVGIDSLQMISLMLRVEEEFGVNIDFETFEYAHLESVEKFSKFIESSLNKDAN